MNYEIKNSQRKCSMRFLLIPLKGSWQVITQDMRRSAYCCVTGNIRIRPMKDDAQYAAKLHGCGFILRQK